MFARTQTDFEQRRENKKGCATESIKNVAAQATSICTEDAKYSYYSPLRPSSPRSEHKAQSKFSLTQNRKHPKQIRRASKIANIQHSLLNFMIYFACYFRADRRHVKLHF